jgi:hypothetical protein
MARMRRICEPIPADVELGIHLCYGDFGARHMIEPVDAGKMVAVANAMARSIEHRLAYIHMPVPVERTDDAYYRPLQSLKLAPETEIYLGLVHVADGADGTRKRMDAARRHVTSFGVATECGMARARTPELVEKILAVHAQVTREPC